MFLRALRCRREETMANNIELETKISQEVEKGSIAELNHVSAFIMVP